MVTFSVHSVLCLTPGMRSSSGAETLLAELLLPLEIDFKGQHTAPR